MPLLFLFQQYQEVIPTLPKKTSQEESFYIPRHFLPFGQADIAGWVRWMLRCDPFAVHLYGSMDRRLASAAS
jgi:hypothetical protein